MPNFGGSRLGFWFNRQNRKPTPTGTARSDTRGKNALIVYDLNTPPILVGGQLTNPYTGSFGRVGYQYSPQFMSAELKTRLESYGWTVTVITSYASFLTRTSNADIAQIWDLSFATVLPSNVVNSYTDYLKGGGAICLLGEETDHNFPRDSSMCSFVGTLGGGIVSPSTTVYPTDIFSNMAEEFRMVWDDLSVVQSYASWFKNYGSTGRFSQSKGTKILSRPGVSNNFPYPNELEDRVYAAMWKTNSLSVAPAGALILILDSTYFYYDTPPPPPNRHQPNFIENMIFCLDYK